jgi:hypothetical protein
VIQETIDQVELIYPADEEKDAEIIRRAISTAVDVLNRRYGLQPPSDCRVILMTGWQMFLETGAPGYMKLLLPLIKLLQGNRFEDTWKLAGGWNQKMGRRIVAGIKPGRLIEAADRRLGEKIFLPADSIDEKVFSVTCHELTHAFSDHLRLPSWLNEGLAMLTADHALEKTTIRKDTLEFLKNSQIGRITRLNLSSKNTMVLLYVRAYWLTRWLEQEKEQQLQSWLKRPLRPGRIDMQLAAELKMSTTDFWSTIDHFLYEYFTAEN